MKKISESTITSNFGVLKSYICECPRCGNLVNLLPSEAQSRTICADCVKKERDIYGLEKARLNIGKRYGSYTVMDVIRLKSRYYAVCRCDCGAVHQVLMSSLTSGTSTGCKKCRTDKAGLEAGHEIVKICGEAKTNIIAVTRHAVNKNSTTGYNGVSQNGLRYRAYINLRRVQYHLGTYDTPEEANAARLRAEKEIHENFIDWYKDTYPEQMEKIKKLKGKKE